jgi:hypothetical protein
MTNALQSLPISIAEVSSTPIENLGTDENGDLWVRSFLINTKLNERSWQISEETAKSNVTSIIGKPLIMYKDGVWSIRGIYCIVVRPILKVRSSLV